MLPFPPAKRSHVPAWRATLPHHVPRSGHAMSTPNRDGTPPVSIMSSNGVPIQDISDTVGHKSTHVTETVYRHVIRPTIRGGATVMDDVFEDPDDESAH